MSLNNNNNNISNNNSSSNNNNNNNNNSNNKISQQPQYDEDGFVLVVKGKKNKVLKVNQKVDQVITTNDNKKNKQIRDKYLEKQNQFTSNYIDGNNNSNNKSNNKKNNKLLIEKLTDEQQLDKLYNQLLDSEKRMKETQFFKDIIESQVNFKYNENEMVTLFENIHDIVCYGIGDFSSSKKCLDQLAYITSIKSLYNITGTVYIFDPVMNEVEKKLVDKIGIQLIQVNEEGKRKINTSVETNNRFTLFYMPFCGRKLYDNVLWANWQDLSRVLIIGNSFDIYIDGINKVEDDYVQYSYTSKSDGIHSELLFPKNYPTPYIFHDLSIHIFPPHLLNKKDQSFYSSENNLEPPKLVFGPE